MLENLIYAGLLAIHNIALVILSGGLFFMTLAWQERLKAGSDLFLEWDNALENKTLKAYQLFMRALIGVTVTGFAFPITHVIFHGKTKEMSLVATSAFGLKMILMVFLVSVLLVWGIKLVKPLKLAFEKAKKVEGTDAHTMLTFNELKKQRLSIIKIGFILTVLILIVSPFLTFF